MKRGKQTCRILKEIRRQIAEANDIEFITSECQYKGDCPGTCPKCEAEVRYLEEQLNHRRMTGKNIALAGISAGMMAMAAPSQIHALSPLSASENQEVAMNDTLLPGTDRDRESVIIGYVPPTKKECKDSDTLMIAQVMPQFPGGMSALINYLQANITYHAPELQESSNLKRVTIQFLVLKDGSIHNPRIIQPGSDYGNKEAMRIVRAMPKWKPGMHNGEIKNVFYTLPVIFEEKKAWEAYKNSRIIKGIIKDKAGNRLTGATIYEKDTGQGTVSGTDGTFSLRISGKHPVVFAYIGYQSEERESGTLNDSLEITLKEDDNMLMGEVPVKHTLYDSCTL